MKNLNLIKIILIVIVFSCIFSVIHFIFNTNNAIIKEDIYSTREEKIKEIAQVYKDKIQVIGKTESAFITEHEIDDENMDIKRQYYIYAKEGKNLIKIKEYEGTYENNTPILKKEIYIDLSKKVEGSDHLYNDVTEINTEDFSSKVIDNYEFKNPIDKLTEMLNIRYDFNNGDKNIAADSRNEITVYEHNDSNLKLYGWSYEIKENENAEYLSFSTNSKYTYAYFSFEKYTNNNRTESTSMQISKLEGNLDDVTVPEL